MTFVHEFKLAFILFSVLIIFTLIEFIKNDDECYNLKERAINLLSMFFIIFAGSFLISLLPRLSYRFYEKPFISNPYLYALMHLLFIDTFFYLYHRAQHHFKFLWKIHHFHHSGSEMNVTTSYRTNIIDVFIQHLILVLPAFYLFGYNVEGLRLSYFLSIGFLFFTHLKIDLGSGLISKIIVTPSFHAIHHSHDKKYAHKNYAQVFSFLDLLGKTYEDPKKRSPTDSRARLLRFFT